MALLIDLWISKIIFDPEIVQIQMKSTQTDQIEKPEIGDVQEVTVMNEETQTELPDQNDDNSEHHTMTASDMQDATKKKGRFRSLFCHNK